jgi:hypothetical protein
MNELEKYLNEFDGAHSEFQIEHFIIKGQGHLFFQYQQSCRELRSRHDAIKAKKGVGCSATKREMAIFLKIAKRLRKRLRWDALSAEQKKQMERMAWFEKARQMLAVDLICSRGHSVSKSTVEFVMKLPKAMRVELIDEIQKGSHRLIEWAVSQGD